MYGQSAGARLKLPERAAAVALLLLLHAALFFLLNPKFGVQRETRPLNEIAISFNLSKPREMAPPNVNPVFLRPNVPAIAPPVIPELKPLLPALPAPNVSGVGRSLFNCDLANGRNLSAEQRTNCLHFGLAPPAPGTMEAGMPKTERAKQSERWAAGLAARQSPVSVPCTSLQQEVFGGPGLEKQTTTLLADPLCLLNGLLNGFHSATK